LAPVSTWPAVATPSSSIAARRHRDVRHRQGPGALVVDQLLLADDDRRAEPLAGAVEALHDDVPQVIGD